VRWVRSRSGSFDDVIVAFTEKCDCIGVYLIVLVPGRFAGTRTPTRFKSFLFNAERKYEYRVAKYEYD